MYHRIKYLVGAILIFAIFNAAGQKPTASEAELRKQADKHFTGGNFTQATPMYSQLLSLFPLDPVLNYRYGVSLMEAGKEKSTAALYLDFAVRNPPVPDDAWLYLGRSHMMAGNFSKAFEALTRFKSTPSASKSRKTEIDLLLNNCKNAEALQADRKNIAIINSQEIKRQNFHTSYDYSSASGKIVPTADQFLTTQDKDKQINPVMFMTRDGQNIFYSSYGRGSSTGKDIYRVRKMVNGQWGTPENLGTIINSSEHEDYPYLDRDGRTLYFSSRGHSSIGGYDLFKSVYDFNTNKWSEPENLGIPLNTAADEFLYIPEFNSNQAVYYTSFENISQEITRRTISTGDQGGKFAVVTGTYYSLDQATRRDARISVLRASDKAVVNSVRTDPKSGRYELVLPPGEDYTLLVEGGGYLPHAENFSLPDLAVSGMRQEVKLNKDKSREQMTVSNFFTPVSVKEGETNLAFKDTPTEVSTSVLDLSENDSTGKVPVRIDDQVVYVKDPLEQSENEDRSSIPVEAKSVANYGFNDNIESSDEGDSVTDEGNNLPGIKIEAKDRYDPTLADRLSDDEIRQMEEEKERAMIIEEEEKNPNMIVDINIDNDELAQIALEDARSLESDAESMKLRAEVLKSDAARQDSLALTLDEDAESIARTDPQKRDELISRSTELKESALVMNREATSLLLQASIKMDESRSARRDAEAILKSLGRGDEIALLSEKDNATAIKKQQNNDFIDSSFPEEGDRSEDNFGAEETQTVIQRKEDELPEQKINDTQSDKGAFAVSTSGKSEDGLKEEATENINTAEPSLKNDDMPAGQKADGVDANAGTVKSVEASSRETNIEPDQKTTATAGAGNPEDQSKVNAQELEEDIIAGEPGNKELMNPAPERNAMKDETESLSEKGDPVSNKQAGQIAAPTNVNDTQTEPSIALNNHEPLVENKEDVKTEEPVSLPMAVSEPMTEDTLLATTGLTTKENVPSQTEMPEPDDREISAPADSNMIIKSGTTLAESQPAQISSDSLRNLSVNEQNDIHTEVTESIKETEEVGIAMASDAKRDSEGPEQLNSEQPDLSQAEQTLNSDQGNEIAENPGREPEDISAATGTEANRENSIVEEKVDSVSDARPLAPTDQSPTRQTLNSDQGNEIAENPGKEPQDISVAAGTEASRENNIIEEKADSFSEAKPLVPNKQEFDQTAGENEMQSTIVDATPSGTELKETLDSDTLINPVITNETLATRKTISNDISIVEKSDDSGKIEQGTESTMLSTDHGRVQYNSGRETAFVPETAKAEIKPEARVIYDAFENNVKSSEKLFNQSRSLQKRVLDMPRSPERDSLVEVSNALSRESSRQFNIAQSQLEDAMVIDRNLSQLLIRTDVARIATENETSGLIVSEHIEALSSDTVSGREIKSVQEDSQTELALSTRTTTSVPENVTPGESVKSGKKQLPLSRAVEDNGVQSNEHLKGNEVPAQTIQDNSEQGASRTQEIAGVPAGMDEADGNTGQSENTKEENLAVIHEPVARTQGEIQTRNEPEETSHTKAVELSAEGLDINHPRYPEYQQVQTEITNSQVETINLFAEGVNLNKQSVEEKQRQVELLDSAQRTDDESLRAQLLTAAADLAFESEKHQEESVAKLSLSQKKTHEVKALTAKMEELKQEISSPSVQSERQAVSVESKNVGYRNNTGPNAVSLAEKTAAVSKTGNVETMVPEMSDAELSEFNSIKYGKTQGPAYSKVNPIPLNPGLPDGLVFKIQIGAFRKPIPDDSFKNLQPVSAETSRPGWLRYCVGMFRTFEPANLVKKELRKGEYKDAFVVAYYNGERISLQEANSILGRQASQTAYLGEMRKEISALSQLDVIKSAGATIAKDEDEKMFYGNSTPPVSSINEAFGPVEYTVQVGVYRNQKPPSVLAVLEPIYTESMKGGLFRFTSGRYEQRSEAERAKRVAIDAGVSDAFVIPFKRSSRISTTAPVPASQGADQGPRIAAQEKAETTAKETESLSYRVQLGAFRQNVPFEMVEAFLTISDKGIVRISDERGLNIFYAGNFSSYEEARALKEEIISKGVKDAFVVAFSGTKRIPLSTAAPAE